jgi:hypothetical protein
VREPALGSVTAGILVPIAYLAAFGTLALWISTRRLARMLLA